MLLGSEPAAAPRPPRLRVGERRESTRGGSASAPYEPAGTTFRGPRTADPRIGLCSL